MSEIRVKASRSERQIQVAEWGKAAFGADQMSSVQQRLIRLAEETFEACQAGDVDLGMLFALGEYVYGRPKGELSKEVGGVSVCVLALAGAMGEQADKIEAAEILRVLSKPLEHFSKRNQDKNDAGFKAIDLT